MSRNASDESPFDPNVGETPADAPQENAIGQVAEADGGAEVTAFEEPPMPGSPGTEPPVIITD